MDPKKVKAVVFDLGKVLLDFDYGIAAQKIAAHGRLRPEEVVDCMLHAQLLGRYECGLIDSAQFFTETCAATGFCGTADEFADCFGDIFVEIEPMVQLHASLRENELPTFIFSNTNEFAVRFIRRRFPFFAHFDGYVLSYEHGFMKPDARLYDVVEKISDRSGSEILYLDDRIENVEAGAARGWRAILHQSPEQSRAEIAKVGLFNGSQCG